MFSPMKGLISSIFIIVALIALGIVASYVMSINLDNRVVATQNRGLTEGEARGYQAGFQQGSIAGYQAGSQTGYASSHQGSSSNSFGAGSYFTYNPSYQEVQALLARMPELRTGQDADEALAFKIHDYAEANGLRAAYVRVQLARPATEGQVWVQRLVAFETVDRGFIIIEPGSQRAVTVEAGKRFRELNGFSAPAYDDTIARVTIIW